MKEERFLFTWVSVGAGLLVTSYSILVHQLLSLLDEEEA